MEAIENRLYPRIIIGTRVPNKRLKLTAPGFGEELRLCASQFCISLNLCGAGAVRRRSLSAIR